MPTIDLHLSLEFSETVKPAVAAAFAKSAIEAGYMTVAGMDDELVADAADAFDDAKVSPLSSAPAAKAEAPKSESKAAAAKPAASKDEDGDRIYLDKETLTTLMHAAHYHTEDLQELEDEGMLTNDSQHRAHMKSLHEAVTIACTALGVRRPKPL